MTMNSISKSNENMKQSTKAKNRSVYSNDIIGQNEDRQNKGRKIDRNSNRTKRSMKKEKLLPPPIASSSDGHTSGGNVKSKRSVKEVNSKSIQSDDIDEDTNLMNDPMAFWSAWSERRKSCFDEDGNLIHQYGCNCFEGMGSVM